MVFNSRNYILILIIILAGLRFINLNNFPVFGDETLYLYLAQQINIDYSNWLLSVKFDVFPVTIWILSVFEKVVPNSYSWITLGRFASVVFDIASALLLYKTVTKLFSKQIAIISLIVYLIIPLNFLQSRMILLESFTNFFVSLSFFLAVKILDIKTIKLSNLSLMIGFCLSLILAFYSKPLASLSFIPIALLPFLNTANINQFKSKVFDKTTMWFFVIFLLAGLLIIALYTPVAVRFNSHYLSSNSSLIWYITHIQLNIWRIYWWSISYLTLPLIITSLVGCIIALLSKSLKMLWLCFWIGLILTIDSAFSANFYPRHLHPLVIPISILIGSVFSKIIKTNQYLGFCIFIICLLPSLVFAQHLIQNPSQVKIAQEDRIQYFEDWTSGSGNQEVAQVLTQFSLNQKIYVFAEDQPNQAWAFRYLYPLGNTEILPSEDLNQNQLMKLDPKLKDKPIYIILNRNPQAPKDWPVKLVYSFSKSSSRSINIYKVLN